MENDDEERAAGAHFDHRSEIDNSHDVQSLAVAGKHKPVVYVDRDVPRHDPHLRTKSGRLADLWGYLRVHELSERRAMAAGMAYERAHRYATACEKQAVIDDCGVRGWNAYEHIMDGLLAYIEHRPVHNPPPDPHVEPKLAVEANGSPRPRRRADRR